jgi:hypothetical protein
MFHRRKQIARSSAGRDDALPFGGNLVGWHERFFLSIFQPANEPDDERG